MSDEEVKKQALQWVKSHTKELIEQFASTSNYPADDHPVTVFMAGSPGAGKTEFSLRLIEHFKQKPVLIDADEIRQVIPGYKGKEAHLYQPAASVGVQRLYDHILEGKLNVIVDGTFAHGKGEENVQRSLKRGRSVIIQYLHQDPIKSWEFTQAREKLEYRNIPKDSFIRQYFGYQEKVMEVKEKFGRKVTLHITLKDFKKGLEKTYFNADNIDSYVKNGYDISMLEKLLS